MKVGLFVIAMLAGLIFLTTQISRSGFSFKKESTYYVYFKNSSGLLSNSPVEYEGFRVGHAQEIELETSQIKVKIKVSPTLKIYTDSRVFLQARGLLGEKIIQIEGGGEGDLIPSGGKIIAENKAQSFEDVVENMSDLISSVKEMVKGTPGKNSIQDIIDNTAQASQTLRRLLKEKDEDMVKIVTNMRVITDSLRGVMQATGPNDKTLSESVRDTIEKIDRVASNLDAITSRIERGEGSVGKLLKDEKTAEKINDALDGVNELVGGVKQLELGIGFRAEFMASDKEPIAVTSFRLKPAFDKYFLFEFTDGPLGFGKRSSKVTTTTDLDPKGNPTVVEEKVSKQTFSVTAIFARRFGFLTGSAGLFRSSGGFGAEIHLLRDHLDFGFQAFDFNRDTHPHLRLYAKANMFRIFYLNAGADDILHRDKDFNFFGGAGFILTDDDVKRLLGLSSIATSIR